MIICVIANFYNPECASHLKFHSDYLTYFTTIDNNVIFDLYYDSELEIIAINHTILKKVCEKYNEWIFEDYSD